VKGTFNKTRRDPNVQSTSIQKPCERSPTRQSCRRVRKKRFFGVQQLLSRPSGRYNQTLLTTGHFYCSRIENEAEGGHVLLAALARLACPSSSVAIPQGAEAAGKSDAAEKSEVCLALATRLEQRFRSYAMISGRQGMHSKMLAKVEHLQHTHERLSTEEVFDSEWKLSKR
jgi:hypothetical protein